jgi:hypothetical protein
VNGQEIAPKATTGTKAQETTQEMKETAQEMGGTKVAWMGKVVRHKIE